MKRATITGALILATVLLTLTGFGTHAGETVYQWKDAEGNQVNSDRPPPLGTDYEVVSTSSTFVREVDAKEGAVPLKVKPTADNEFKPVESSTPAVIKNPDICATAKDNLAQIDSHARIRMRNDNGEVYYLSEEQKAVERNKALESMKEHCD